MPCLWYSDWTSNLSLYFLDLMLSVPCSFPDREARRPQIWTPSSRIHTAPFLLLSSYVGCRGSLLSKTDLSIGGGEDHSRILKDFSQPPLSSVYSSSTSFQATYHPRFFFKKAYEPLESLKYVKHRKKSFFFLHSSRPWGHINSD